MYNVPFLVMSVGKPPCDGSHSNDLVRSRNISNCNVSCHVVDKFLAELQTQLDDKKVVIYATDDARGWMAEQGYDPHMGARPMARLIQEKVKKPLAEMILFGQLADKGGTVKIDLDGDELSLVVVEDEPLKEKANA